MKHTILLASAILAIVSTLHADPASAQVTPQVVIATPTPKPTPTPTPAPKVSSQPLLEARYRAEIAALEQRQAKRKKNGTKDSYEFKRDQATIEGYKAAIAALYR